MEWVYGTFILLSPKEDAMLKLENFKNLEVVKALETLAVVFNYQATIVALPRDTYHVTHGEREFLIRGLDNLIRELMVAPWDKSHPTQDETAGHWEIDGRGQEAWKWHYRNPARERALRRYISDRDQVRKTVNGYAVRTRNGWVEYGERDMLEHLNTLTAHDLYRWWGEEPLPEELIAVISKYVHTFAERKLSLPQFWTGRLGL